VLLLEICRIQRKLAGVTMASPAPVITRRVVNCGRVRVMPVIAEERHQAAKLMA